MCRIGCLCKCQCLVWWCSPLSFRGRWDLPAVFSLDETARRDPGHALPHLCALVLCFRCLCLQVCHLLQYMSTNSIIYYITTLEIGKSNASCAAPRCCRRDSNRWARWTRPFWMKRRWFADKATILYVTWRSIVWPRSDARRPVTCRIVPRNRHQYRHHKSTKKQKPQFQLTRMRNATMKRWEEKMQPFFEIKAEQPESKSLTCFLNCIYMRAYPLQIAGFCWFYLY